MGSVATEASTTAISVEVEASLVSGLISTDTEASALSDGGSVETPTAVVHLGGSGSGKTTTRGTGVAGTSFRRLGITVLGSRIFKSGWSAG